MALITSILCWIVTGDEARGGTDGDVYLGLGGREFHLDSGADDYERGSSRTYLMGVDHPDLPSHTFIHNAFRNDPTNDFLLLTENLGRSPVYIRFKPKSSQDEWNIAAVAAWVYNKGEFMVGYSPAPGRVFDNLWMGDATGNMLYLTQRWPEVGPMIRHLGKKYPALLKQFKPRTRSRNLKRRRS
jgi:hypothetical protein